MAEETPNQTSPPSIKGAIMAMNPKVTLAFFLVIVAASMVFAWIFWPPKSGQGGIDAGTVALIASFVTMFIKMAADAIGYQYNSSSGSDRKDATQAEVAGKLADKVPSPVAATVVVPWWNKLTEDERTAITASTDQRVIDFVKAPVTIQPLPDDIAYLISKGLLTQARADEIKAK